MSTYERFVNTEEPGADLVIQHNNAGYAAEGRQAGLYVHGGSEYATYSVDDIPRMIDVLQNIYDDYEANKPKEPKFVAEALADFPDGTVIKFDGDVHTRWIKVAGEWISSGYGFAESFATWPIDNWAFVVKYNPNEEAN